MTHSFLPNFSRLVSGGAEEAGMKGWRERAADIFAEHREIAAKMKSVPGPPHVFLGLSPQEKWRLRASGFWRCAIRALFCRSAS